jgi:hypothetical protein
MFLNNIDHILKALPNLENGYYLPFHSDHIVNFKGIIEYESQSITIEDRIHMLEYQSQLGPSITAFVNNIPVAVFGIVFLWKGVGEAWSLFTQESRRYPIAMTKGAFAFFDSCQILFNLHRLQITVKCTDKRAVSWAKHLGFVKEGTMIAYSADKDNTYMMRRT